jgi:diguanylate cyclase (GGDEF)-like protein
MQAVKLFAWLAIIWGVSYLLEFLEIRRRYPRLIWLVSIFLLIFSLMYVGSMFFYLPRLDMPLRIFHVLVFIIYLGMAARLWWRGALAERYLGLSLFAMFAAGLVYLVYIMGYIDHSALAVGALDYGLALGAGFLTLSLAEQIRQERIQQEMAFHRMLSQESELRAIREDALYQQERENQKLKSQMRNRDAELSMVMEHLRESHDRLESMGGVDGLTGLFNVRRFRELLSADCATLAERKTQVSLLILDIDDFRQLNEMHGHVMGDEVLRTISFFMRSVATRPHDLLSRFAGEEMAAFLPDTDREGALVVAERLRRMIVEHTWPIGKGSEKVAVTVSIGVATLVPEDSGASEMLVNQAKLALKRAKGQGKNQTAFFEFMREGPAKS